MGATDGHRALLFILGHQQDAVGGARGEASSGQGCGQSPRMLAPWGLGSLEDRPLNRMQEVEGRQEGQLLLLKTSQGVHVVPVGWCTPKSCVEALTPGTHAYGSLWQLQRWSR